MKCYIPEYPRPQFVRGNDDSWRSLNGTWDFAFDDANEGKKKRWYRDFPRGKSIVVPFTYETEMSGIADTNPHELVWYRTAFHAENGRGQLFLHFEGSDYKTEVWINGLKAGVHEGGYARFSFDITELITEGGNELVVRVEDRYDMSQPRGKQHWKNGKYGCWYIQSTGIWKTVWLEYVPEAHITHIKMTPLFNEKRLALKADIDAPPGPDMEFEVRISFKDTEISVIKVPVLKQRLSINMDIVSADEYEWGAHTWSPEHPALYDISFTLRKNGKSLDTVLSYFGMREIRIDGSNILLNGIPLYQRLILDQGYWRKSHLTPPDETALISDIDNILAAGYNGVRKHQKIEDECFLYWADVKGLLVWSEMAACYEYSDQAVTRFTREWMEIIRQNYNHPSIITWTPFNESWGIPMIGTDRNEQHFTEAIYHLTKSFDPMRPVVVNDGWEHTVSDIITLHDYEEKAELFLERYREHLDDILANKLYHNLFRNAFAKGFSYQGQPVIISEYGAIALDGQVSGEAAFLKCYDTITTAIKQIGAICGYCYTQITDVHHELNGLMDMDHVFKLDPVQIKEINIRNVNALHRPAKNKKE